MPVYEGPKTTLGQEIHAIKYRSEGESFDEYASRMAGALSKGTDEFRVFRDLLGEQRFLPGGRIQSAIGSPRQVTAINCFVSGVIEDNMNSIMRRAAEAAQVMRLGGGIGYDFSGLRPAGDRIKSLDSKSSGPVSFMGIFDAICKTISSAGHRRGAQMGVLRIDHPDIRHFIKAKRDQSTLTGFNMSIAVTDHFINCLLNERPFALRFANRTYEHVDPVMLWDEIMRNTWDWAEPGVIFIDTVNRMNNLHYMEKVAASNPCGEQMLPPYGSCLLGSFNLVKYIHRSIGGTTFAWGQFAADIAHAVTMLDRVIDLTLYPLPKQQKRHQQDRRMGLGITGLANAGEAMGYPYGSEGFLAFEEAVLTQLRDTAYQTSIDAARELGAFPTFKPELLDSGFAETLPPSLRDQIASYGLRNSHLISMAPTGTISLAADNISASIEPPFALEYTRQIIKDSGPEIETVKDFAWREWGIRGRTANELTPAEHLAVLTTAQRFTDSAVSKTLNIGDNVGFDDFKQIYMDAWLGGAKGCTTYRAAGQRAGVLVAKNPEEGGACRIDPTTGKRSCDE